MRFVEHSYLLIGGPASGHKYYVETSEASNRNEEQACNTHYSQPDSTSQGELYGICSIGCWIPKHKSIQYK